MQEIRHIPQNIPQIIGTNIATRRAELKWTRRELAERIRTDQTLVFKWERGQHRPSDHYLGQLSAALDRPVGWFYTEHDSPKAAA